MAYLLSTRQIVDIAMEHLPQIPDADKPHNSAWFCYRDAEAAYARGDALGFQSARRWALKSLAYSVGVAHPDYKRVERQM